jgi:hypothetical protein
MEFSSSEKKFVVRDELHVDFLSADEPCYGETTHLVILSEEHEPVIRGQCSSCPEVLFVVDRTAESCLRIVHEMFDAHFDRVHQRDCP